MRVNLEGHPGYAEVKSCKVKEFQLLLSDATNFQQACLSGNAERVAEVMEEILTRWATNLMEYSDDLTIMDIWNILVAKAGPLGENIKMLPRLSAEATLDFLVRGGWEKIGIDLGELPTTTENGDG